MAEATVNGTTLYYELEGSGPPLAVLHGGLGLDHHLYRATMGELTEEHRVLWYDHRGNGRSGRPPVESITIEQLADDAAALLDTLDMTPAVVLGHSYGGYVAQELALRHPDAVTALVLVAVGPGHLGTGEVEGEDGEGPPVPADLAAAFTTPIASDDDLRRVFAPVLRHYVHSADLDLLQEDFDRTIVSWEAMVRGFQVLAGWSSVDRLGRISAPTLVVGGKRDPVLPWPQQVRVAKRIPDAELVLFDDASHFVWMDQPMGFWAVVEGFLYRDDVRG